MRRILQSGIDRTNSLEAYRVVAALVLSTHFILLFKQTWWLIELPLHVPNNGILIISSRSAFVTIWISGLIGCVGVAINYLSNFGALMALFACIVTNLSLSALQHMDDYIATFLALWLVLIPWVGSSKRNRVTPINKIYILRIYLVTSTLLYGNFPLWNANVPGGTSVPIGQIALVIASATACFGGLPMISLFVSLAGHIQLLATDSFIWSHAALAPLVLLYFDPDFERKKKLYVSETNLSRINIAAAIATCYCTVLAVNFLASFAGSDHVQRVSTKLLKDLYLLPPRLSNNGPGTFRSISTVLIIDEKGRRVEPGFLKASHLRIEILYNYLLQNYWRDELKNDEGWVEGLRLELARKLCRSFNNTLGSFRMLDPNSSKSKNSVLAHFYCGPEKGEARLLARSDYQGPLPSAASSDFQLPRRIPLHKNPDMFIGSTRCRGCHSELYNTWRRSAHARTFTPIADQDARDSYPTHSLKSGVTPLKIIKEKRDYFFMLGEREQSERHSIDFVLGSGKQLQAFVAKNKGEGYSLIPLAWSSQKKEWVKLIRYHPEVYDPQAFQPLQVIDLEYAGCLQCHTTSITYEATPSGVKTSWVEPSVGCEACHGPGKQHKDFHSGAEVKDPYVAKNQVPKTACIACHALREDFASYDKQSGEWYYLVNGIEHSRFKADGTPRLPSYQQSSFELSYCYQKGNLRCNTCHNAHRDDQEKTRERSLSACRQCHKDIIANRDKQNHFIHAQQTCLDCHMSRLRIDLEKDWSISATNHAISIPRPRESALLKTRSACDQCHKESTTYWQLEALERRKANKALEIRDWVETVQIIKQNSKFPPPARLEETLQHSLNNDAIETSMLRLIARIRTNSSLIASLRSLADDSRSAVRAAALLALARHDIDSATHWLSIGQNDKDAFVRLTCLQKLLGWRRLNEMQHRKYLIDLLTFASSPPISELIRLSRIRQRNGELSEAHATLELAKHYAFPQQKEWLTKQIRKLNRRIGR